jgi:hypothetical protein
MYIWLKMGTFESSFTGLVHPILPKVHFFKLTYSKPNFWGPDISETNTIGGKCFHEYR